MGAIDFSEIFSGHSEMGAHFCFEWSIKSIEEGMPRNGGSFSMKSNHLS
jgi:hypothetical protein